MDTAAMRADAGIVRDYGGSVMTVRPMASVLEHSCCCTRGEKTPAECVASSPDRFRWIPNGES